MKKILKFKLLIAISSLMLFALSCDIEGVTDSVDITISNNILKQEALISILDITNPENLEGNSKLKVELIGADANKFVTNSGENASKLKVVDGNIALAVNPIYESSEPLKVLLKISGDDYLTTTIPVVLFPDDTLVTQSINIVNKLNTVQGIDFKEESTSLTNNTLPTDYLFETPAQKATTRTEIQIEAGTLFQDADGNTITGTDLKSEVAHFSLDTPESLASFPGGLTPISVIDEDGVDSEDISFISAGFTSVDMFVGGKEVKNFSKPISLAIEIPEDYINPDTGNNIVVGEQIPIWSYDDNGQWSYHDIGTVLRNAAGKFSIKFTTTHLSWYNLDYYGRGCSYNRRTAVFSPRVSDLSDNFYELSFDLVYAHNDQIISRNNIQLSKTITNNAGFYITPSANLKLKVYYGSYDDRILVYTSETFDGCSSNNITLDTSAIAALIPPKPQIKNINIQYTARCGDKILRPFLYIYRLESYTYKGRQYNYWNWVGYTWYGRGYVYSAQIGVAQKYRVYFGGTAYDYDYTFNSDNIVIDDFEVPGDLCSRLF
jgi:hypothetical protein